ncbi:tripartite tricarboxylate transporter substrate binding protein [Pigmentiphaga sp. H8]|uniref:Bug family tripartite tricarboxylate transporter substrate binding protein n=1 Tax=unclassified Pigmentiphaga TaxID=2626614 RepID=UPI000F5B1D9D|nr:tripartite tricarboxylate transporter substrate binding protein [Pigmentiphaga sp. H8]AZG10429.1 tripartite tricarboxylate transporter substrate binding protein [Pigmentiphaga sp. H8]
MDRHHLPPRRGFLSPLLLTLATLLASPAAWPQAFPQKPVKIVVGFGPGGLGDTVVRTLAQKMAESLGQSVVVENAPGAGGITAASMVARAAPDGYTLLLVSGQNAFSPYLFKSLPYDPVDSFSMISTIGTFHFLLVADKDSPLKTVDDVVAAARRDPAHFNIGTISVGSAQHLSARLFATMAGLDVPIVPFKSTGDVIAALRGRNVQVGMETVTGALGQIRGGSLRAIATTGSTRIGFLPDVPTIAESGNPALARYESDSWNGIVAPAGTPPAVVRKLNQEIGKALQSPDVRQRFIALGIEPRGSTPEALKEVFQKDAAKWRVVIEEAGIEKQ